MSSFQDNADCDPERQITFGSLFAGIGGFDLGFERAGMTCKWQVEIDDYANRVLAKHWPTVRRWPDVRTWPQQNTERVDVICGGFPCQDISGAGNVQGERLGIDGSRSGLWGEFERIVREIRPSVVVVENSPKLISRGLGRVLGGLASLGYDAEWGVLSACSFRAPHTRERLFIIANSDSITLRMPRCAEIASETGGMQEEARQWERLRADPRSAISDLGVRTRSATPGGNDGIPNRMDRNRCLGNAVVPQVSEFIGRRVVQCLRQRDLLEATCP